MMLMEKLMIGALVIPTPGRIIKIKIGAKWIFIIQSYTKTADEIGVWLNISKLRK